MGSIWDRALVGLFAVAIVGGLLLAMSIAFGWTLGGNPGPGDRVATAQPTPSGPNPDRTIAPPLASADVWTRTANRIGNTPRGGNTVGERYAFDCPPGGMLFPVFGTRLYTSDSSVCSAAVHWGLITVELGGLVVIEIRPGHEAYRGTRRHGVMSRDSGRRPRSFRFVES
jgi:LCCL domain